MRSLALVCLLIPTLSHAATWEDFSSAFPAFPCHDGWTACVAPDGERITPDLIERDGLARASTDRLEWGDLEATGVFDPFGNLSPYEPFVPAPPPPPEQAVVTREVERETAVAKNQADKRIEAPDRPAGQPIAIAAPDTPPTVHADKRNPETALDDVEPGTVEPVAFVRPDVEVNVDCSDLVRLEPMAMMGKLTDDHVGCLEARLAVAETQTEKSKISVVLIKTQRTGSGPWEHAMRRHLTDIDQSDPDIAYIFASHLSKKGASRAEEALKWASTAQENKTRWSGKTFVDRVYGLHKIQSRAAYSRWKASKDAFAASNAPEDEAAAKRWEGETKVYAREWYEYADEAGRDTTKALQLCMSAAGTEDYCTGG